MKIINWDKTKLKKLSFLSSVNFDKALFRKVSKILQDVREKGDSAVRKYTKEFDGLTVPTNKLLVTEKEINQAYSAVNFNFMPFLKSITKKMKQYYENEIHQSYKVKLEDGGYLGKRVVPMERVGAYIPGGQAPLVSTVYMTVLPATIAGVKEIAIATPPSRDTGYIDPHILVVADLLGVKEIYKMGGAQAIGAFAFGTKVVPKVDKIVGPGNTYVTEAKRQCYGFVDIDMVAGPSEVAILADHTANPDFIEADLKAQAEHRDGVAVLITPSKKIADEMEKRIEEGYIIMVKNIEEGVKVINNIAPEHLEIMTKDTASFLNDIEHCGTIFVGDYSPAAIGDYVAGPNHVLPTGGTGRFFSPLGVSSFLKSIQTISYTKKALEKTIDPIAKITEIEKMIEHRRSVEIRFPNLAQTEQS